MATRVEHPAVRMVVIAVVVALGALAIHSEAAISCGTVISYARPCLPYVTNKGPIGFCCGGVKGLLAAAKTKDDRQSVCRCLKTLASISSGIDLDKAAALPATCGVSIPYKISPTTDCSKVT